MANTPNYNNVENKIKGSIDSIITAVDLLPFWKDLNKDISLTVSSPLWFILQLTQTLGFTDALKEWLAEYVTYMLPPFEAGVKGVLLANLASNISCTTQPLIPDNLREFYFEQTFKVKSPQIYLDLQNSKNTEIIENGEFIFSHIMKRGSGVNIPINSIDYNGLLNCSPFSQEATIKRVEIDENGETSIKDSKNKITNKPKRGYSADTLYFGVDKNESPYLLTRAEDFNAFLWFVKNKGIFRESLKIETIDELGYSIESDKKDFTPKTLFTYLKVNTTVNNENPFNYLVKGGTVQYAGNAGGVLQLCTDITTDINNNTVSFKLQPVSSSNSNNGVTHINWYVNSQDFLGRNLGVVVTKNKILANDRAIFKINYNRDKYFNFKILPKPFIHYPIIEGETNIHGSWHEPITRIKKITFDSNGKMDNINGKFSVSPQIRQNTGILERTISYSGGNVSDRKGQYCVYKLLNNDGSNNNDIVLYYDLETSDYSLRLSKMVNGRYIELTNDNLELYVKDVLYECYPGLTIYQFNYDYIMGMKLLNGKVVLTQLFNSLLGLDIDVNLSLEQIQAQQMISDMVQKIINTEEEINTCYFSFDNKEQDKMLLESELKYKHQFKFNDNPVQISEIDTSEILENIRTLDDAGTLIKQKEQIQNIFNTVTSTISNNTEDSLKLNVESNFINNLCTELVYQLVINSLMTPKVMMLLQINNILIGKTNPNSIDIDINFESVLKNMFNLIYGIAKELANAFIEQLFEFVLSKLKVLLSLFASGIVSEYVKMYTDLLTLLISECGFKIGFSNLSGLDNVAYADIDNTIGKPDTKEC